MEYGKIIAVTGLPGLFELISSKNDGAIVRSLEDKSTKFVSSRVHNFSHLESIEVFTVRDNVNLIDIFHSMEKEGASVPDGKDSAALKKYFEKVYPDLDFERVYTSDLKKMVKWYDVLKANDIELKLTQPAEDEEDGEELESSEVEQEQAAQPEAKEPAKSRKAKSSAPLEQVPDEEATEETKPKKAARKKSEPAAGEAEEKEKSAKAPAKKSAPKKK